MRQPTASDIRLDRRLAVLIGEPIIKLKVEKDMTKLEKLTKRQVRHAYQCWLFEGHHYVWDEAALSYADAVTGEIVSEIQTKQQFAQERYGQGANARLVRMWLGAPFPSEALALA